VAVDGVDAADGRGWGKSKAAAEAVGEWARTPGLQIAVVAKNATLVRDVCFDSPKSGLLAVFPPEEVAKYNSSLGETTLGLKNGTLIRGFGAETPDNLRGWAFDNVWCDEYAAWSRHTAQEVYDMLWFCLCEADARLVGRVTVEACGRLPVIGDAAGLSRAVMQGSCVML